MSGTRTVRRMRTARVVRGLSNQFDLWKEPNHVVGSRRRRRPRTVASSGIGTVFGTTQRRPWAAGLWKNRIGAFHPRLARHPPLSRRHDVQFGRSRGLGRSIRIGSLPPRTGRFPRRSSNHSHRTSRRRPVLGSHRSRRDGHRNDVERFDRDASDGEPTRRIGSMA